jgi:hypothetical protein
LELKGLNMADWRDKIEDKHSKRINKPDPYLVNIIVMSIIVLVGAIIIGTGIYLCTIAPSL